MSLSIIKAGICDTIQGKAREGFRHLGINPGGAMDPVSAQMTNVLAGNDRDAALLEMHFPAAVIRIDEPCILVIGGADLRPSINGTEIPLLQPVKAGRNSELRFSGQGKGCWCYMAVAGGLDIQPWVNSYATNLKAGAGGWKGRMLQKGDRIPFAGNSEIFSPAAEGTCSVLPWRAVPVPHPVPEDVLWIRKGPQWPELTAESRQLMEEAVFTLLPSSDRMGYGLRGPALHRHTSEQIVSAAVDLGSVQLLPDGQLMVLMADHQTTGGYPQIAYVIRAHMPRLAQQTAGTLVKFNVVDEQTAMQQWLLQYQHIEQLTSACTFKHFK